MSKGSWSRVKNHKAWQESPLWDKKPTRLIDIIKEYPSETLTYDKGFDFEQYDLPIETHFKAIEEIPIGSIASDLSQFTSKTTPRIFLITNNQDQTCKVAVWMD